MNEEGQLRAVWSIGSVRVWDQIIKTGKKLQNIILHNLCISYDINESQNNEMCRECDTLGNIAEYGFQKPKDMGDVVAVGWIILT